MITAAKAENQTETPVSAARPTPVDLGRAGLIGLLVVQILIGYEWLISGLTKIIDGGFPQGLAAELRDSSQAAPAFYKSFLDSVVIPHGQLFGYLVEIDEIAGGVALIAAALIWMLRWPRLSVSWQTGVLLVTAVASAIGIFMNVNFHLANGGAHPWLIPPSGFDEGVDLDSLMPEIQLVLVGVAVYGLRALRRGRAGVDHV
jgi:thiosulfate dehydrogenase [quinone] large subunit